MKNGSLKKLRFGVCSCMIVMMMLIELSRFDVIRISMLMSYVVCLFVVMIDRGG